MLVDEKSFLFQRDFRKGEIGFQEKLRKYSFLYFEFVYDFAFFLACYFGRYVEVLLQS
jgi:hypothetical protein